MFRLTFSNVTSLLVVTKLLRGLGEWKMRLDLSLRDLKEKVQTELNKHKFVVKLLNIAEN